MITFSDIVYGCFSEVPKNDILDACNSTELTEAGESASPVTWSTINGQSVGEFTVKIKNSESTFTIVIAEPSNNSKFHCRNLKIKEFKFYDEGGDVQATSLMAYHLGVGPTIVREFKRLLSTSPECVIFTSNKVESSRVRHYEKRLAQFSSEFNYVPFYRTAFKDTDFGYALVRSDKIEEFRKCFKTTNI